MSIHAAAFPVMPTRPCSFCLSLQGGSVFADFDTDSGGTVPLRRISFDGYGCCDATAAAKMSPADSRVLLDALARGALASEVVGDVLTRFFRQRQDIIWSDALKQHGLL
ncbi:MAG TPA: hypothetical protein VK157_10780 [Phycisphaerales bacterium]|nr:hypothetical protein [Phycisphaerales bacterium]